MWHMCLITYSYLGKGQTMIKERHCSRRISFAHSLHMWANLYGSDVSYNWIYGHFITLYIRQIASTDLTYWLSISYTSFLFFISVSILFFSLSVFTLLCHHIFCHKELLKGSRAVFTGEFYPSSSMVHLAKFLYLWYSHGRGSLLQTDPRWKQVSGRAKKLRGLCPRVAIPTRIGRPSIKKFLSSLELLFNAMHFFVKLFFLLESWGFAEYVSDLLGICPLCLRRCRHITSIYYKCKFQSLMTSSVIFGTWSYMSAQAQTHCAIFRQRCVEGHASKSASE